MMLQKLYQLGSPPYLYNFCLRWQSVLGWLCVLFFLWGLVGALFLAPTDAQQGDVYRIVYLHVPAAILSLSIYLFMSVFSLFYLIWKIKIADLLAKVSAHWGVVMTGVTLITGSLWGKPTWGTFWIWDARLTSELILLFIYLGIISLRQTILEKTLAAQLVAILTCAGLVNIPIIHFSVDWWQTLHQGATLLRFGMPHMAKSMLFPLLAMLIAFFLYYLWHLCISVRIELITTEKQAHWLKLIFNKG